MQKNIKLFDQMEVVLSISGKFHRTSEMEVLPLLVISFKYRQTEGST